MISWNGQSVGIFRPAQPGPFLSFPYRLFGGISSDIRILAQAHIDDISPLTGQTESAIATRKCQCFLPISGPARVNDSMVRRVTGSLELFAFAVGVFS